MSDLPEPKTRKERYLNAIATGDPDGLPEPVTREEIFLAYIAQNGGGGSSGSYNTLGNKPKINGEVLKDDKSFEDLGLKALTAEELAAMWEDD